MARRDEFIQISKNVPFDNSSNGFSATDVQTALEELNDLVGISASPGFTYGRSGNLPRNTWLLNDTVPSNVSGRINFLNSATITRVFIANENPDVIKLGIYTHDGNEINLTLIGTVTTAATRSNIFTVSFAIGLNKQMAARIEPDSPTAGKNMDVGIQIQGTV